MTLRTRICELFEIEVPVVLAGMGGASTPPLAAAVSNAGGLGVLGAAACGPNRLRQWIRQTRDLTDKPFGVDTLLPASVRRGALEQKAGPSPLDELPRYQRFAREFMEKEGLAKAETEDGEEAAEQGLGAGPGGDPLDAKGPRLFTKEFFDAQMEVVIEERVPVYAAGLGNPGPWMDRLHVNGTRVIAVIGQTRHAVRVLEAGVDCIVAQGHDGGGHNAPVGTLALIPQVRDVIGDLPLLGAGGIGDGRGLAAALMLGADGVWIGTTFLATREAGLHGFQKQALVEGNDASTVVSRSVTGKPARLIRSLWTEAFDQSGLPALPMPFQSMVSGPVLMAGTLRERGDIAPGFAGQGLGMIHEVRPAAEVLAEMVIQAETVLAGAARIVAS